MKQNDKTLDLEADSLRDTYTSFDRVAEICVSILLVFMPLAFGAVEAWSEQIVIHLSSIALIAVLLKRYCNQYARLQWYGAYIPLILFVGLVLLQAIPLPHSIAAILSPNTVSTKTDLLNDLTNRESLLEFIAISFYPYATWHQLRLVFAGIAMFVVVLHVYRHEEGIKRLLTTITAMGGAVAILALLQIITQTNKIFWIFPSVHRLADAGSFVNHSNFAQFMNLSVGAALALVLMNLHKAFTGRRADPVKVLQYLKSPAGRGVWFPIIVIVLGMAAVFTSLSRGGMIGLLVAAIFTTLMLGSRQSLQGRAWIMALLFLGAFVCTLYVGFDAVYDRMASLDDLDRAQAGRFGIMQDIYSAWFRFPLFGTGLGTHPVVYPMFDTSLINAVAYHADNDYIQAVEEIGLIGVLTFIAFLGFVWFAYYKCIRSNSDSLCYAAYGLGFGLITTLLQSFTDFGQHLPANFMLSATVCALLLVLSKRVKQTPSTPKSVPTPPHVRIPVGHSLILLLTLFVSVRFGWSANQYRKAEASWSKALAQEAYLNKVNWETIDENLKLLVRLADQAVSEQPNNADYRHWRNVYRWQTEQLETDPNTGYPILTLDSIEFMQSLIDDLNIVRKNCPTHGPTYSMIGQFERILGRDEQGKQNILHAYELAPSDATVCYVAGTLYAEEDDPNKALELFSRASQINGSFYHDCALTFLGLYEDPNWAIDLAADNISWLRQLENILNTIEISEETLVQVRERINTLVQEKATEKDAPAWSLASLAQAEAEKGNLESAIEKYRKALKYDYDQVGWRYQLARLLGERGEKQEAIHQAKICLRIRENYGPAVRLIENLSSTPNALDRNQ